MKARAIFIDMDGTLLTTSNTISQRNMEAVHRLIKQGIKVFLATGRHYAITAPYHKQLGLNTPVICLNGAAIYDGKTGKAKQIKTVQLNEEELHKLSTDMSCKVLVHTANGLYCNATNEEIDSWTKVGQVEPLYIGDLRLVNYQDVLKYSVRTGKPIPEISVKFREEAEVVDWDDGFELVAPNVSKWSAISSLLSELQIRPEEVVTIGDGPNDMEMLRYAGMGIAMGNASEEIKAVADFVTGHHERDGLAEFIEHFLLNSYRSHVI